MPVWARTAAAYCVTWMPGNRVASMSMRHGDEVSITGRTLNCLTSNRYVRSITGCPAMSITVVPSALVRYTLSTAYRT